MLSIRVDYVLWFIHVLLNFTLERCFSMIYLHYHFPSNYKQLFCNLILQYRSCQLAEAASTAKYKCFAGTLMNQNDIISYLKVFHLLLQYLTTILNQQRMSFCKFWNCFSAVVFIYKCFFWFYDKTKVFNRSISKFSICSCVQKIFPWR